MVRATIPQKTASLQCLENGSSPHPTPPGLFWLKPWDHQALTAMKLLMRLKTSTSRVMNPQFRKARTQQVSDIFHVSCGAKQTVYYTYTLQSLGTYPLFNIVTEDFRLVGSSYKLKCNHLTHCIYVYFDHSTFRLWLAFIPNHTFTSFSIFTRVPHTRRGESCLVGCSC